MKFVVSTKHLLNNLSFIDGVVSNNTVLPILEDFLFDIAGKTLTVSSTDLETSMTVTIDVDCKDSGKIAVPARILMNTLKSLPDQPITYTIDEDTYAVGITSDNGEYRLAGENGDEYPKIPMPEGTKTITMEASVLADAIGKTMFATSTDELRPAMNGVFFDLSDKHFICAATDAHKLSKYTRTDIANSKPVSFILPKKALALLQGALAGKEGKVTIAYNNANAFFTFDNVKLVCRLIDAKFPDYNNVIPKENPHKLLIHSSDLLGSLKRLANYANKTTHSVTFNIKGNTIQLTSRDIDYSNEGKEELTAEYTGDDIEISFNSKFLIDILTSMNSDEVEMTMSTPSRPVVITPSVQPANTHILMLVMPIMMNL